MPEYKCMVEIITRREIKVFARDSQQAKEKAAAMVNEWPGVQSAECDECEDA